MNRTFFISELNKTLLHPERSRRAQKAFTLFESVVAITIITILLGLSTMIYSNVLDAEPPIPVYQAQQEIDRIFQDTKSNQAFFDKNFDFETYNIEQKVQPYKGNKKLYQIDYTITTAEKSWGTEKHLVANRQYVE